MDCKMESFDIELGKKLFIYFLFQNLLASVNIKTFGNINCSALSTRMKIYFSTSNDFPFPIRYSKQGAETRSGQ